jgi:hypothetical protein
VYVPGNKTSRASLSPGSVYLPALKIDAFTLVHNRFQSKNAATGVFLLAKFRTSRRILSINSHPVPMLYLQLFRLFQARSLSGSLFAFADF